MLVFIMLLENCENYVRKNENGSNACAWKGIAENGVGAWVRRLSRRCQKRGKREWKQKKWTNCTLFLQKERLYLNFANGFRPECKLFVQISLLLMCGRCGSRLVIESSKKLSRGRIKQVIMPRCLALLVCTPWYINSFPIKCKHLTLLSNMVLNLLRV